MERISETALLVAMYRALETDRPDALIQDPYARQLAGDRGRMAVEVFGDKPQATDAIALRTRVIDEQLLYLIQTEAIDTVINLAAGLDTRPYRLDLPPKLCWIEVDLPEILTYKTQILRRETPNCQLEQLAFDITDREQRKQLFCGVNAIAENGIVLSEGLLSYLPESEVISLSESLHECPNLRWWIAEVMSASIRRRMDKAESQQLFNDYFFNGEEAFQFAPELGVEFFEHHHWHIVEFRRYLSEVLRFKRGKRSTRLLHQILARCLPSYWNSLCRSAGIVLLHKSDSVDRQPHRKATSDANFARDLN